MEENEEQKFEDMDLNDLSLWLVERDIPLEFCNALKANYIDGIEFVSLSKEDIEKIIPQVGMAKKIMRLQPGAISKTPLSKESPPIDVDSPTSGDITPTENSFVTVSTPSSSKDAFPTIPSNWTSSTEKCITDKKLNPRVRCDIVRTLVTLLVAKHGARPKKSEVEYMARQLILKYPFMRDDIGTGYASWYEKLLERLRNLRKRPSSKTDDVPATKKGKGPSVKKSLLKRYPPHVHEDLEDPESVMKHISLMSDEMRKKKPRDIVVLPLLKSTYAARRDYVTSEDRVDVKEILNEYPALHFPSAIEQDMNMMFNPDGGNLKSCFMSNWRKYVLAVLAFTEEESWSWRKDLDPSDTYSQDRVALKCLIHLFKCSENFIFDEVKDDEDISEVIQKTPEKSSPRMVVNVSTEKDKRFYVVVEQEVLCQATSFSHCLFLLISSFFVLHLQYPEKVRKVLLFLQDYVLGQPDNYQTVGVHTLLFQVT